MRQIEALRNGLAGIGGLHEGRGVSEGIGIWKAMLRDDVLAGLEVPPDVGIGDIARCQREQAEKEDGQESAFYSEQSSHKESIIAGARRAG